MGLSSVQPCEYLFSTESVVTFAQNDNRESVRSTLTRQFVDPRYRATEHLRNFGSGDKAFILMIIKNGFSFLKMACLSFAQEGRYLFPNHFP